ncbi:MAG: hypothetical protein V1934_06545, partial [Methanobacteriota archaeon]
PGQRAVLKDNNGNYVSLLDDRSIDSLNNLHIIYSNSSDGFVWRKINDDGFVINSEHINGSISPLFYKVEIGPADTLHCIGLMGDSLFHVSLDRNGSILAGLDAINFDNVTHIYKDHAWSMALGNEDTIHIVYYDATISRAGIYYTQLDNYGDVIIEPKLVSKANPDNIDIDSDAENNVHTTWGSKGIINYIKLDSAGNILKGPIDVIKAAQDTNNNIYYLVGGISGLLIATVAVIYYWREKKKERNDHP